MTSEIYHIYIIVHLVHIYIYIVHCHHDLTCLHSVLGTGSCISGFGGVYYLCLTSMRRVRHH